MLRIFFFCFMTLLLTACQWSLPFANPFETETSPKIRIAQLQAASLPDLNEARNLYQSYPDNPDIALTYARALRLHGDVTQSLDVLRPHYHANAPADILLEMFKSTLLTAKGQESERLIRSQMGRSDISATDRGQMHHLLAVSLDLQGAYEDATQHYIAALELLGDDPAVRNNYALSRLQGGDANEASEILRRTLPYGDPQIEANKQLLNVIRNLP